LREDFRYLISGGDRGNKRGRLEWLRIMIEIQKLLISKNDDEIMDMLGMRDSTYYRYKSKIYKQDKKLWDKVASESLGHMGVTSTKRFGILY